MEYYVIAYYKLDPSHTKDWVIVECSDQVEAIGWKSAYIDWGYSGVKIVCDPLEFLKELEGEEVEPEDPEREEQIKGMDRMIARDIGLEGEEK